MQRVKPTCLRARSYNCASQEFLLHQWFVPSVGYGQLFSCQNKIVLRMDELKEKINSGGGSAAPHRNTLKGGMAAGASPILPSSPFRVFVARCLPTNTLI